VKNEVAYLCRTIKSATLDTLNFRNLVQTNKIITQRGKPPARNRLARAVQIFLDDGV
jgi:hypothetical protein